MTDRLMIACAAAYLAVGIVTFGHAAAHAERRGNADYAACLARKAIKDEPCWIDTARPSAVGMTAALTWPLYWSWEFWS